MDPVKRQTIVREIEHWRNSKLLPGHYCDFLLNLYIDEHKTPNAKKWNVHITGIIHSTGKYSLSFCFISLILICSLYFTSIHPMMQIMLLLSVIGVLYSRGLVQRYSKPINSYVYLGIASILLLFIGEFILSINQWVSEPAVVGTIAFSGVVWILIGLLSRVGMLHFCGWACVIMAYTWLVQWIHPQPEWYVLQIYAFPVFIALFTFGKSWLINNRAAGWLLIVISGLFLLNPEIYGLIFTNISNHILISGLIGKIIGLSVIAWLFLKKPKTKEWASG
jgi:hypothetical protein